MKYFLSIVALVLLLSSCSIFGQGKKNSPEYVTEMFLSHVQKLEFDEAAQYGTEKTKMALTLLKSLSNLVPEETRTQNKYSNAVVHDCTIDGNTAKCRYTANQKDESVDLIRQDGTWLVNL